MPNDPRQRISLTPPTVQYQQVAGCSDFIPSGQRRLLTRRSSGSDAGIHSENRALRASKVIRNLLDRVILNTRPPCAAQGRFWPSHETP